MWYHEKIKVFSGQIFIIIIIVVIIIIIIIIIIVIIIIIIIIIKLKWEPFECHYKLLDSSECQRGTVLVTQASSSQDSVNTALDVTQNYKPQNFMISFDCTEPSF